MATISITNATRKPMNERQSMRTERLAFDCTLIFGGWFFNFFYMFGQIIKLKVKSENP